MKYSATLGKLPYEDNRIAILFSGGMGSFLSAYLLKIQGYKNVTLYFNDTLTEDDDLYRFLVECQDWLGYPMVYDADGRDVFQVFIDNKYMGNTRVDACSRVLKRERSARWIKANDPSVVCLGIDIWEEDRLTRGQKHQPLFRSPLIDAEVYDIKALEKEVLAASNIHRPRLYDFGFQHNNCFSGDEKFLTDEGVFSFSEKEGDTVNVLSKDGSWQSAQVKSFGVQQIGELTLTRYHETEKIKVTPDHLWYVRKGCSQEKIKSTFELLPGDKIPSLGVARDADWTFVSYKLLSGAEKVYCAVLNEDAPERSFALDRYIKTHNCSGWCVKAGLAHYKNLWEQLPERYLYFEKKEQEVYDAVPTARPFLRKNIAGETHYITLRQYRTEYLEPNAALPNRDQLDLFEQAGLDMSPTSCIACAIAA